MPLPPRVNSEEFRIAFKERLLNPLAAFRPDLLLLSSGFDGHQRDLVNDTFAPCSEWDFQWLTRFLVAVANETCNGRIGTSSCVMYFCVCVFVVFFDSAGYGPLFTSFRLPCCVCFFFQKSCSVDP